MNNELIRAAISYVELLFAGNADGHGFDHTMRVYRNAMKIAGKENCDRQIVALAALLHDADDHKLFHTENNRNARAFLNAQKLDAIRENPALSALADQLAYTMPQGQYPSEYWSLATGLGDDILADKLDDADDAKLMEVLTNFQDTAISYANK